MTSVSIKANSSFCFFVAKSYICTAHIVYVTGSLAWWVSGSTEGIIKIPISGPYCQSFRFSRSEVGPGNLHLSQVPRWHWCCQPWNCSLRTTAWCGFILCPALPLEKASLINHWGESSPQISLIYQVEAFPLPLRSDSEASGLLCQDTDDLGSSDIVVYTWP